MVWLKSCWDAQWSTQVESVHPHLSASSYCKKGRKSTLATFIFLCPGKDCMCACSRAGCGIHKRLNSYRHNYLLKEKPRKSPLHLKCTQFVMIPGLYKSCSAAFVVLGNTISCTNKLCYRCREFHVYARNEMIFLSHWVLQEENQNLEPASVFCGKATWWAADRFAD